MNKNKKSMTTSIVIVFLLLIGVVYAILQANLQINGVAKIQSNTWDIHFDNIQVNSNSVSIGTGDSAATIDPENNCKVDFEVTLSIPGDFYEFTVDVVNAGTIDGMIGEINRSLKVNNEDVDEVPDYLSYTITYDDGTEILENHLLKSGRTLTYKIRLELRADLEELPDAATINCSFQPQHVQADSTAIRKIPYNPCTYDGDLVQGAEYTNGQYTYRYMQEGSNNSWSYITDDGWGVHLTDKNSTDPVTTPLCTSINDKPIVSMSYMFFYSQTTIIDTSSFDTSNVTDMSYMFHYCSNLNNVDVSVFDTKNVTDMSYMFSKSRSLSSLDVSNFDTSNVTNMTRMFNGYPLTDSSYSQLAQIIGIENFDTSKVNDMSWMFAHLPYLTKLDLRYFDTSKVTTMHSMFNASYGLEEIKGLENFNTSNVTDMKFMFANDESSTPMKLKSLNLTSFDTSKVTVMTEMFERCTSIKELDLSSFNMTNVTDTNNMFNQCTSLTTGYARTQADADKFNNSTNKPSGVTFVVKP